VYLYGSDIVSTLARFAYMFNDCIEVVIRNWTLLKIRSIQSALVIFIGSFSGIVERNV